MVTHPASTLIKGAYVMKRLFLVMCCAGLAACSTVGGEAPQNHAEVVKPLGSRQCEGGGATLEQLTAELTTAGVQVISAADGSDGRMYPTVCGAPDGRIGVFAIPTSQVDVATGLGFQRR